MSDFTMSPKGREMITKDPDAVLGVTVDSNTDDGKMATFWVSGGGVGGSVVLEPGTAICLQGVAAAGTSPLVIFGMKWGELPV